MSKEYAIDLALKGHDEGAEGAVESLGRKMKVLRKEERESGDILLKRALGGGADDLVETGLDLLGGGKAALAGYAIGKIAKSLDQVVEKMSEVGKTSEEVWRGFADAVPVIGPVFKLTQDMKEYISGGAEEEKKLVNEINAASRAQTEHLRIITEVNAELKSMGKTIADDVYASGQVGENSYVKRYQDIQKTLQERLNDLKKDEAQAMLLDNPGRGRVLDAIEGEKADAKAAATDAELALDRDAAERGKRIAAGQHEGLLQDQSKQQQESLELLGLHLNAELEAIRAQAEQKRFVLEEQQLATQKSGVMTVEAMAAFAARKKQIDADEAGESANARQRDEDRLQKENIDRFNQQAEEEKRVRSEEVQTLRDQLADRVEDLQQANKPKAATLLSNRYHGFAEDQKDRNEEQTRLLARMQRQLEHLSDLEKIVVLLQALNGKRGGGHVVRP